MRVKTTERKQKKLMEENSSTIYINGKQRVVKITIKFSSSDTFSPFFSQIKRKKTRALIISSSLSYTLRRQHRIFLHRSIRKQNLFNI